MNQLYPNQYPAALQGFAGQFASPPYAAGSYLPGAASGIPRAVSRIPGVASEIPGAASGIPGAVSGIPGAVTAVPGYPDLFLEDRQSFDDARRLQSFYPQAAQEIQHLVEEECDKMEYEGSMMFDEYPDRLMIRKLAGDIVSKVREAHPEGWEEPDGERNAQPEAELNMQSNGWDRDRDRDRRRRRRRDGWLGDLAQVLLLDEMHRRRCRHRRCRSRRFW